MGGVGERFGARALAVEWSVHLAMVAALGTTYLAVFGVVLALRRLEGRRATVLALVVVAREAVPLLCPLLCLDGGVDCAKAVWEGARRKFFL